MEKEDKIKDHLQARRISKNCPNYLPKVRTSRDGGIRNWSIQQPFGHYLSATPRKKLTTLSTGSGSRSFKSPCGISLFTARGRPTTLRSPADDPRLGDDVSWTIQMK
ncbi:hypothetical protein SAY87_022468 [Trapa incisa]|uniref:Uncharacterized protein n=1 Tax=Trapa incisa TaxID=236973 RepID=A0AAN7K858_9MYRT|nr:hypothetical protein SAY87_022468 [Trapa incisa]